MLQVFGIPNCDTVKKARRFLDDRNVPYEFNNFKKSPPTLDQLKNWESQVGEELVNKRGRTFRQIKDDYEVLGQAKRLELLQNQTSAIKRPIIESQGKVLALGFDESDLSKVLLEKPPAS
jgi:Spx/MgsR family transcriptional regulator